jgi:hypothetical protein
MKRLFFIQILAVSLVLAPASTAYALTGFPAFPMAFWGTVTINGDAAPVGSVVRTYYGSALAGTVTVSQSGIYGFTESTKQKLIAGEGTGQLSFTIQASSINSGAETSGTASVSYPAFSSGVTIEKNLAFTVAVLSSGGSSSGGGGGGSGGGVVLGATIKKGDASGDGKVDILDFNSLLIQWGKSGTGLTTDFNGDGVVDILDFNQLLINWEK